MLRPLRLTAILVCASLTGSAFGKVSEEPTPGQIRAAAEAFDLGREAYQKQDYVNAAEQFERADSQAPSATALEYAIRARDRAGHLDRAATLAVLARARHPDDPNLAKLAPAVLDRAKKDLYVLTVRCMEPCELAVDGKIVHGAPQLERTVYLAPGSHTVRAGFDSTRSDSADVNAVAGGVEQVAFEPPAPPPNEPEPAPVPAGPVTQETPRDTLSEPPSSGWSPAVFWVGAGLTAAAGAVTVWSGIDTLNNPGEDRVQRECQRGDTSCPAYQQGLNNQRRTNILIGVTGGLAVGTALIGLLATDWGGEQAEPEATRMNAHQARRGLAIEPYVVVGGGAMLGAQGRF